MMRNAAALGRRSLGRADVEPAIDLDRIIIDDFAAEFGSEKEGECAFPAAGGTADHD